MSDLTLAQSTEYFTVRVHNYKDDPAHDAISLHGLYTDREEAERIAHAVSIGWDFITADVQPIRLGTITQIAEAQDISHIAPDLPEGLPVEFTAPASDAPADIAEGMSEQRDPVEDAIALAPVVHEADWMMAGPRWPWHQASVKQREDAILIAQAAIATPSASLDELEAIVQRLWSSKPTHGAPRRIEAKASKIREWLVHEGLRDAIDAP